MTASGEQVPDKLIVGGQKDQTGSRAQGSSPAKASVVFDLDHLVFVTIENQHFGCICQAVSRFRSPGSHSRSIHCPGADFTPDTNFLYANIILIATKECNREEQKIQEFFHSSRSK